MGEGQPKPPSLKKRSKALTVRPLHKPTRAQPRQPSTSALPSAPPTKRAKLLSSEPPRSQQVQALPNFPPPHVEVRRSAQMARLRRQFTAIFKTATPGNSPDAPTAFERWHFTQLSQQHARQGSDPLIPLSCDQGCLIDDMSRLSATPAAIRKAEVALAKTTKECAESIHRNAHIPKESVRLIQHKFSCDIIYGRLLLKINPAHLEKLRAAFVLDKENEQQFLDAVCSLLLRYRSLSGHGFQAALNEAAMDVLREELAVTCECFASPLNFYFPAYFSAFPDTDAVFGSFGSFLAEPFPRSAFDPRVGGSFECNPPFVPAVMLAAVRRLHAMAAECERAGGAPFSVVVVVPGWTEDAAWVALRESALLVRRVLVAKADHGFVDGAQHQRRDRYRESPFDTELFVLQNVAARRQWPVRRGLEQRLRAAMAQARPSPAAVQRRLKEGRGLADADGGGGVYKGKKRQKREQQGEPEGGAGPGGDRGAATEANEREGARRAAKAQERPPNRRALASTRKRHASEASRDSNYDHDRDSGPSAVTSLTRRPGPDSGPGQAPAQARSVSGNSKPREGKPERQSRRERSGGNLQPHARAGASGPPTGKREVRLMRGWKWGRLWRSRRWARATVSHGTS